MLESQEFLDQYDLLDPLAFEKWEKGLKGGEPWAVQLFFYYRYGR